MHFNINIKKAFWLPGQWWVWIDLFAKQFVNILIISARCQRLDATNSTGWSIKKCCTGLEAGKSDKQKRAGGSRLIWLIDWRLRGRAWPEGLEKNTHFIAVIKCRRCSAMCELSFCPRLLHRRNNLDSNLCFLWRTLNSMCAFSVMQNKGASSASL